MLPRLDAGRKCSLRYAILDRVFEDMKELGQQDGTIRKQSWAVSALLSPVKTGGKDAKPKGLYFNK